MNKYNIYELMGEYTDEEFAPAIDNNTDVNDVRKCVKEKIEKPRRHIRLKTALIAAAVAAATVICTGVAIATYSNHVTLTIDMLTNKGVVVNLGYSDNGVNYRETDYGATEEYISPLELREGRLWFVADGQDFDVTDMIDMETAYIYKTVNPDTGLADWIVIGGIPECYGFYEIMKYGDQKDECTCEKEFCMHCRQIISWGETTTSIGTYTINGEDIPEYEMTEEERAEAWNMAERGEARYTLRTAIWMRNAREELGLSWQNMFESEDGTIISFGMED